MHVLHNAPSDFVLLAYELINVPLVLCLDGSAKLAGGNTRD